MELLFEGRFGVFLVLTIIMGGGAAFMAGRALARGWRPMWRVVAFMVPLTAADRFLHYALFEQQLTSAWHFVITFAVLTAAALLGYRMTLSSKMVRQYPWLYEKAGVLGWRPKG